MSNRTYRVTEIVGTSPDGIDQAIRNAVERASKTLRHVDWFEMTQVRGQVKDGDRRALPGRAQGRVPARGRLIVMPEGSAVVDGAGRAEGPRGTQPLLPAGGHQAHPRRDRPGARPPRQTYAGSRSVSASAPCAPMRR